MTAPGGRGDAGDPVLSQAAVLILLGTTAVLGWWGWEQGGFFDVVFLPGSMILLLLLAVLAWFGPWPVSLRGPALVAIAAMAGLSAWTLLSAFWSPLPSEAISDAQHAFLYAVALGLGIWLAVLMRDRPLLALSPVVVSVALVGIATVIALWTSNSPQDLVEGDATLRYPIGYRNAEAAFFLAAVWPMVVFSASRQIPPWLRGLFSGSATVCLGLAVLAQSRGSVFAVPIALAVLVAVHPRRLNIVFWTAIAAIPAAVALPWLLEVYRAGHGSTDATLPLLRHSATAIALTAALATLAGWAMARLDPVERLSPRSTTVVSRVVAVVAAIALVVGVIGATKSAGGPIKFISHHASQINSNSSDLGPQGARFGLNLQTERGDLWRVAIDDFKNHPVAGEGAGSFWFSYLLHRHSLLEARDTHSVELQMAAELGIPGVLLFATFLIAAVMAVLRARRVGEEAAALAAGALAMSAYWLVHASVDWFFDYAAITLPAMFALGVAAGPSLQDRVAEVPLWRRRAGGAVLVLVAVTMVPLFFSARYTNHALRTSDSDLSGAYRDLDRAADLNPWSSQPLAAKASIAEGAGDEPTALRAINDAIERTPEEWILYWQKAKVLAQSNPAAARAALAQARARNPTGPEIEALGAQLGVGH
jgi:hypothetical protein